MKCSGRTPASGLNGHIMYMDSANPLTPRRPRLHANGTHIRSHKANGLPASGVGRVLAKRGTPSAMAAWQKPLTFPELFEGMEPLSLIQSLAGAEDGSSGRPLPVDC
ncbi:hypothetical protein ROHU_018646 [Labeo rohita]|uniref:Uncharacterized protein n=1 Tax=Labeo rohita TaxID=84645 RepID=A0A498NEU5_LABRO|nr:hypothetical protein ROHU_018646 [Labeo rohita]